MQLALARHSQGAGQVALGTAQAGRVVEFAGRIGEAQAEDLFAQLAQLLGELFRSRSRISLAFIRLVLPQHELGLDGELVRRQPDGFASQRLGDSSQLEHDPARLDNGHPAFGRALA